MDKYTAVTTKSGRGNIISVGADNLKDAADEIQRQLTRPGRFSVFEQWRAHGCLVRHPEGHITDCNGQAPDEPKCVENMTDEEIADMYQEDEGESDAAERYKSAMYGIRNAIWNEAHDLEFSTRKNDRRLSLALEVIGYAVSDLIENGSTIEDHDEIQAKMHRAVEQFWKAA